MARQDVRRRLIRCREARIDNRMRPLGPCAVQNKCRLSPCRTIQGSFTKTDSRLHCPRLGHRRATHPSKTGGRKGQRSIYGRVPHSYNDHRQGNRSHPSALSTQWKSVLYCLDRFGSIPPILVALQLHLKFIPLRKIKPLAQGIWAHDLYSMLELPYTFVVFGTHENTSHASNAASLELDPLSAIVLAFRNEGVALVTEWKFCFCVHIECPWMERRQTHLLRYEGVCAANLEIRGSGTRTSRYSTFYYSHGVFSHGNFVAACTGPEAMSLRSPRPDPVGVCAPSSSIHYALVESLQRSLLSLGKPRHGPHKPLVRIVEPWCLSTDVRDHRSRYDN